MATVIKSREMQLVEQEYQKPLDEVLQTLYRECGSIPAVAVKLGVKRQTVWKWCRQLGLDDLIRVYKRKQNNSRYI